MVEFNQSLEPTFDNMMLLPRKEGSETYVFQDLGEPFAPEFLANQAYNISEETEKIVESMDNFPVTVDFGEDTIPVTVVSLEDILLSMKNDSRFVILPGPRLRVQIAFFIESSLCSIVSFKMFIFSIILLTWLWIHVFYLTVIKNKPDEKA
jgi:hypothetical protein